ncbi:MAG: FAD-binding oxidoreductase [Gammaproteobacteria bacterium]|nr:FAD-binding oxidoreductase [Gammaproteobacteria bacterium]
MKRLSEEAIETLQSQLRGEVILPDDPDYDEARTIWNAMIDKRPGAIARCSGVADVMQALQVAKDHDLLLSVRSGGHNIAGNAICDGGLTIDLSGMKSVHIDPHAQRAYVEPGATLGDLDHEAQAFGLATSLGINSTTGVAGLTLGGGFGWLTRKYGMTVDNLMSVEIVTADGRRLWANKEQNADLFWAACGGGGNFGVVTLFDFKLHPVGPEVLSGLIVYPFDQAKSLLNQYREYVKTIPDDLSVWVVLRKAPPLPFLPEEVHGTEVVVFALMHAGDIEEGKSLVEPLRHFGEPVGEHVGVNPFAAWQQAFDPLLTPGARNYWKSHNFAELSDEAIDTVIEYAGRLPSPQCEIFIALLGGEANRVAADATAYAHRDVNFVLNVHARWDEQGQDKTCVSWSREFFNAAAPYAMGGVYVNFMTQDETDRIGSAYGPNYDRLVQIKQKYDPDNLFHMNQNIKPRG